MRPTGHVMMAMSLDGFIARLDHGLDWLMKQSTTMEDHGFAEFMQAMDVIVMGSRSFKTVVGIGEWYYEIPVIVMSATMTTDDIPPHLRGKADITRLNPLALMDKLGREGCARVYVDGGAVVRSFMSEGLIADMKVTIVPILIGKGIRLFDDLGRDFDLNLISAISHSWGLVDLNYQVMA